jgi:hypothetical protein
VRRDQHALPLVSEKPRQRFDPSSYLFETKARLLACQTIGTTSAGMLLASPSISLETGPFDLRQPRLQ